MKVIQMKMLQFGLILIISLVVINCRKKNTAEPMANAVPSPAPAVTYDHYLPFKKGNSWIYERFQVEQNGSSTSLQQYDSVYVEKDTVIRNNSYWKIKKKDPLGPNLLSLYLRDSLHYIVDHKGGICFSSVNFSTVFSEKYYTSESDTIVYVFSKMNDKDLRVNTAAGSFLTSSFQQTFKTYPAYTSTSIANPRYMNTRYCKDVGIITETEPFFLSVPFVFERRLIRFHVN